VTCANNLRQIGLALNTYHEQYGQYPILGSADGNPSRPWRFKFFSLQSRLLPHMGESVIYNNINFDVGATVSNARDSVYNATAAASQIETFLCPSDPRRLSVSSGNNNYRINMGTIAETIVDFSFENGPFSLFGPRRSSDIQDGLSKTAAFSEKLRGDGMNSVVTPDVDIFLIPPPNSALVSNAAYVNFCGTIRPPFPPHDSFNGFTWLLSGTSTTWYNHVLVPNSLIPDCGKDGTDPYRGLFPARSWHNDGVNLLMLDGSTRFVQENLESRIWQALGTKTGGEALSDF